MKEFVGIAAVVIALALGVPFVVAAAIVLLIWLLVMFVLCAVGAICVAPFVAVAAAVSS
jgi:hypothetical protein